MNEVIAWILNYTSNLTHFFENPKNAYNKAKIYNNTRTMR